MKNISIYDNGGKTFDRITIVFNDTKVYTKNGIIYDGIGASENGIGFFQHTICMKGRHLGKKITFENLSEDLKNMLTNYLNS